MTREYLILASNFNKWAGPNNHLLDLCNYLHTKLSISVSLVTHNAHVDSDFAKWIRFPTLPILEGSSPSLKARLAFAPTNTLKIKKTIRSLNIPPNNIFVNASIDTLFETHWATRTKIATGYNVLFNGPNSFLLKKLDRLAAKTIVGRILAHTEYMKTSYMKIGIKEGKIKIVPHCIDVGRIEKLAGNLPRKTRSEPVIFYAGWLIREKGITELLDSFQQISQQKSSTLVLSGLGPLEKWVLEKKKSIEKKTKKGKVFYLGWQPIETLLRKMNEADIVVLPSYNEPFGIILLEAMALKKPIVATRSGGIPEIITDHVNGILVSPRNSQDLTEAILELLNNPNMRKIGLAGYETVKNRYDVSRVAPRFLNFMDEPD
jgi:glycosyltransferase involved in cell wall biosynthesis